MKYNSAYSIKKFPSRSLDINTKLYSIFKGTIKPNQKCLDLTQNLPKTVIQQLKNNKHPSKNTNSTSKKPKSWSKKAYE